MVFDDFKDFLGSNMVLKPSLERFQDDQKVQRIKPKRMHKSFIRLFNLVMRVER